MKDSEIVLLVEAAAEKGAKRALENIGLHDEDAMHDVRELRGLLDSWRETKKTVGQTVARVITGAILTALAAGFWFNFGNKGS